MTELISLSEKNLHVVLEVSDDQDVRLLHFSALPFHEAEAAPEDKRKSYRLLELQATGFDHDGHHGEKHRESLPGASLLYVTHRITPNAFGNKLEVDLRGAGVFARVHLQFYANASVARAWTEVTNEGEKPLGLEYVSSFALTGIGGQPTSEGTVWQDRLRLHIAHNTWLGEAQWRSQTIPELGMYPVGTPSMKRLSYTGTGTWPASTLLPMGILEDTQDSTMLFWQIEAAGSWQFEVAEAAETLYLNLSGPTEYESQWWKELQSDETFETVPVAVGSVIGGIEEAFAELTHYRRAIRRPNADNESLAVIFNDYMNCLNGDPTTEALLPLIDAASDVGCEYFCVDAGWYGDGWWWDSVGEWLPSEKRFPGGLKEVLDHIRLRGMVPGLWLEIEVMGIKCPLAPKVGDDWFFLKHGKRVIDHGRYQLDFRNPAVRAHADEVVDRVVTEYGAGYIKMDYNINIGPGTDQASDSAGDGLLEHNRAYLAWLDSIFVRYPDLIIENCGSGGMRMTYAFLSRHSIQSSSDQTDYRMYAPIAASAPTAVTPEQCAVWSYPLRDADAEQVTFNMINAMLMRIHQSGHMAEISAEGKELVREGIATYKTIREHIKTATPFWPLGLHNGLTLLEGWTSLGLRAEDGTLYVAVWRLDSAEETQILPIAGAHGAQSSVELLYPSDAACDIAWDAEHSTLQVTLPAPYTARLIRIDILGE